MSTRRDDAPPVSCRPVGAERPYLRIVEHLEHCLETYGDTHRGVDWPVAEDVPVRHGVMLDVVRDWPADRPVRILDFGCGASAFLDFLRERGAPVEYAGLDISEKFIELSRSKHPEVAYHLVDVLEDDIDLPRFDYVVMNGVFTEKCDLSFDEMRQFFERTVTRAFALADVGIAFNVMSKHVDWEREDLFHLPFDELARFLTAEVSRDFVLRADYGLYEYTAYVYRSARS